MARRSWQRQYSSAPHHSPAAPGPPGLALPLGSAGRGWLGRRGRAWSASCAGCEAHRTANSGNARGGALWLWPWGRWPHHAPWPHTHVRRAGIHVAKGQPKRAMAVTGQHNRRAEGGEWQCQAHLHVAVFIGQPLARAPCRSAYVVVGQPVCHISRTTGFGVAWRRTSPAPAPRPRSPVMHPADEH